MEYNFLAFLYEILHEILANIDTNPFFWADKSLLNPWVQIVFNNPIESTQLQKGSSVTLKYPFRFEK